MRRILTALVLMASSVGIFGCHTCDVCDDCGEGCSDSHYGAYPQPGCTNCGANAVVQPMPAQVHAPVAK